MPLQRDFLRGEQVIHAPEHIPHLHGFDGGTEDRGASLQCGESLTVQCIAHCPWFENQRDLLAEHGQDPIVIDRIHQVVITHQPDEALGHILPARHV